MLKKEQMIFGNKKQFDSNKLDFVHKQRNQRKRQNRFNDDEKWARSGDHNYNNYRHNYINFRRKT